MLRPADTDLISKCEGELASMERYRLSVALLKWTLLAAVLAFLHFFWCAPSSENLNLGYLRGCDPFLSYTDRVWIEVAVVPVPPIDLRT